MATRHCTDCSQTVPVQTVSTGIPGTIPVEMSLCRCDQSTCRSCKAAVPFGARVCSFCRATV